MLSHVIWRIRTRKLHARAKAEGIDFDNLPEARKYQRATDQVAKRPEDELELGDPSQPATIGDAQHTGNPSNITQDVEARGGGNIETPRSWRTRLIRAKRSEPVQAEPASTMA